MDFKENLYIADIIAKRYKGLIIVNNRAFQIFI